jgi:hypothetical protein
VSAPVAVDTFEETTVSASFALTTLTTTGTDTIVETDCLAAVGAMAGSASKFRPRAGFEGKAVASPSSFASW